VNQKATARQCDHSPGKAAQGSVPVKVTGKRFGTYYAGNTASSGSLAMANTRFTARINVTNWGVMSTRNRWRDDVLYSRESTECHRGRGFASKLF
jgi:hypothetical protein